MLARRTVFLLVLLGTGESPPPPALPDFAEYDLRVTLDTGGTRLLAEGTVRLPAVAARRDSIRLLLWYRMQNVRFELLQPRSATVVTTDSADGDRSWFLRPTAPVPAGTEVVIRFSYRADSANVAQFRVTPQGSYAGGGGEIWYPRLGFDSLGTGMLRFQVAAGETVIAPGVRLGTPVDHDAGRIAFRVDEPVHFGFASGRYFRVSHPGRIRVNLYLLHPREEAVQIAARAAGTLEALVDLFGPLPTREYSIVEVGFGGSVSGTSEFGFFLADRAKLDEGFGLPFFGHEIGHAWWGNLIRTRPGTVGRMMMSEGFAQYGMLQVLERVEGREAAERFRRGEYPGYSLAGSTREYFRLAAAGLEVPLTAFEPKGAQVLRMHRMANTRGFFLLEMLARIVGRERFHLLLRQFVQSHAGRPTSWSEFEVAVSRAAGRDLTWFFDDWLARTGAPRYHLVARPSGRTVRGEIRQADTTYGAVLEVEARGAGRSEIRSLMARGSVTPFEWTFPFSVETVELDPHYRVLRWTDELRSFATALTGYTRADWDRRFGDRPRAIEQFRKALDSLPAPDSHGAEFLLRLGLARSLAAGADTGGARAQLDSALAAPLRPAELLPFAYLELARIALRSGDAIALRRAVAAVASAEAGGGVRTSAGLQALRLLAPPR